MILKNGLPIDAAYDATVEFKLLEKASDDDPVRFSGLASTFGNMDRHGDVIEPGAFRGIKAASTLMLWQHDTDVGPIGGWDRIEETDKGLEVEGHLLKGFPEVDRAAIQLRAGRLKSMSIGFMIKPKGAEWDDESRVRRLKALDVLEISLVSIPANPKARIRSVKNLDSEREFERFLRDAGFSRKEAATIVSRGFRHMKADALRDADGSDMSGLMDRIRRAERALTSKTG